MKTWSDVFIRAFLEILYKGILIEWIPIKQWPQLFENMTKLLV